MLRLEPTRWELCQRPNIYGADRTGFTLKHLQFALQSDLHSEPDFLPLLAAICRVVFPGARSVRIMLILVPECLLGEQTNPGRVFVCSIRLAGVALRCTCPGPSLTLQYGAAPLRSLCQRPRIWRKTKCCRLINDLQRFSHRTHLVLFFFYAGLLSLLGAILSFVELKPVQFIGTFSGERGQIAPEQF